MDVNIRRCDEAAEVIDAIGLATPSGHTHTSDF